MEMETQTFNDDDLNNMEKIEILPEVSEINTKVADKNNTLKRILNPFNFSFKSLLGGSALFSATSLALLNKDAINRGGCIKWAAQFGLGSTSGKKYRRKPSEELAVKNEGKDVEVLVNCDTTFLTMCEDSLCKA